MRVSWFAIVVTLGCVGESVTSTNDAGSDTSMEAGVCTPIAGNKLQNASFEEWVGSEPATWGTDGKIVKRRRDTDAADCTSWLEAERTCFDAIGQTVTLPAPVPAGTVIEGGVMARHVAGTLDEIALDIVTDDGTHHGVKTAMNGGAWTPIVARYTLEKASSSLALYIGFDSCAAETVGFDKAYLIVK